MTRIKYFVVLIWALMSFQVAQGQTYGNEWINHAQKYFKFNIGEDGIYRITKADLEEFNFPIAAVDPRKLQLFHNGKEVAIKVDGQLDGRFDNSDYIEFYGKKMDGSLESPLYVTPEAQAHTYYSLFSDSSAYFLTYTLDLVTGKRMDDEFYENNVNNLPAETSHIHENLRLFTSNYSSGKTHSSNIIQAKYDYGEGWTGEFASRNQSLTYTLSGLTGQVSGGITPQLEVLINGGNNNQHNITILAGQSTGSLRAVGVAEFSGYGHHLATLDLQESDISPEGNLVVRATMNGVNNNADRNAIGYIKVSYSSSFEGKSTENDYLLNANTEGKSYIVVSDANPNISLWDITDELAPQPIGINTGNGNYNAMIPNTSTARKLYAQSELKSISNLVEVTFQAFDPATINYILIGHPSLRANTSDGSGDQIEAYKTYRSSSVGGGYNVLDIDIDVVFNQFNYGNPSPLGIKNLCKYLYDEGSPEFLFLLGKASNIANNYYRQDPATSTISHLVPTFGHPGSDVPFSEGLDGSAHYATISTGRINAKNPDHIQDYLNKVIEREATPINTLRQKSLVHLSGGKNEAELRLFKRYTEGFAEIAKGELVGANTTLISKNNDSAVELINISEEINNGALMVTFFGHSAGSSTDIEIGTVSNPSFGYSNKGKYPVFMVNGCLAGDFFGNDESFGVDWILTPDLGAIAFMAHSSNALSSNLRNYTNQFYQVGFSDINFVGKSVGEIKREAAKRYLDIYGTSASPISQAQLVNLQGDPAVKLFGTNQPDYDLNDNYLVAEDSNGDVPIASVDSLFLSFHLLNYGIIANENLEVLIKRTSPNGQKADYGPFLLDQLLREDTVTLAIPNDIVGAEGNNQFTIVVDPSDLMDEMDETNNSVTFPIFLASASTINLFPGKYSIQSSPQTDFFFQASNLLLATRSFDLEVDTTSTFNSPYLIKQVLSTKVIVRASINLEQKGALPSPTVIYWRTRFTNPLPNEEKEWSTTSFALDQSSTTGWIQAESEQISESEIEGLILESDGLWSFTTSEVELAINTYGSNSSEGTHTETEILVGGRNFFFTNSSNDAGCRTNTLNLMGFKRQSAIPFKVVATSGFDVNNPLVCGISPQVIYNYTEAEFNHIHGPLVFLDQLEQGDHALVYSLGDLNPTSWSTELKDQLENLGINRVTLDNLSSDEPFIFIGAKGAAANSAIEVRTISLPKNEQKLSLEHTLKGNFDSGHITSPLIGPADEWSTLNVDFTPSANADEDEHTLSIYGFDADKNEQLLITTELADVIDISSINAEHYPYLKMTLALKDDQDFTPTQLHRWQVNFTPTPEGILLLRSREGVDETLELQEGETLSQSFTFWNYSKIDFADSVHVGFDLLNTNGTANYSSELNLAPVKATDSLQFDIEIPTIGNAGNNNLKISSNSNYDKEPYSFNNSIQITDFMTVSTDEINPLIDIAFDGIRILDGELVSPSPTIEIEISDENQFLKMTDTLGINLYLRRDCEDCQYERVAFSDPLIQWTAAQEDSEFSINYTPEKFEDGKHSMRILANDASGNSSGIQPFEISFEVVNASTITNFYPYPNPFSSSTRFVFTLTGNEIPEDIKIQILTITGKVVKEIFMNELGTIHIGDNISSYEWNGKDMYGDQLANGVYLYSVKIKNPGEHFSHRETSGDKGFKNGFGKLYLLR